MIRIQILVFLAGLGITGFILEQVRRRKLALEYSLIWILVGLAIIILSLFRGSVEYIAVIMGIQYAPSALFVVFGVIMLLLSIHFSMTVSKLSTRTRTLIQRVALLEHRLEELEKGLSLPTRTGKGKKATS